MYGFQRTPRKRCTSTREQTVWPLRLPNPEHSLFLAPDFLGSSASCGGNSAKVKRVESVESLPANIERPCLPASAPRLRLRLHLLLLRHRHNHLVRLGVVQLFSRFVLDGVGVGLEPLHVCA